MSKSKKKSHFDNLIMLTAKTFCQQTRFNDSNCTCTSNSGSILTELCPLSILMQIFLPLSNFKMIKNIFTELGAKMEQHQKSCRKQEP